MRIKIAAVAALSALALAGCASAIEPDSAMVPVAEPLIWKFNGTPAPEPIPTVTVTEQAPAPEPVYQGGSSGDLNDYVDFVRENAPSGTYGVDDATIKELGQTICEALRSDVPLDTVIDIARENDMSENTIGTIVGGAVVFLCPDMRDSVEAQL